VFPSLAPDNAMSADAMSEPPSAPAADPFGALFTPDDTAARLAAADPPVLVPPAAPQSGELPADEDPLKALFGLQTEEQPTIAPESVGPQPEAAQSVAPIELPTYDPAPVIPAHQPEPAFSEAPVVASTASGGSYGLTVPSAPPPVDDPTAGTQFFGGGVGQWEDPPSLDRTTVGERVAFILAFLVPPVGLIASIIAAVQSSRTRGWVHGFVRAAIVIALVMTVVVGVVGAFFYKQLEDERKHDSLVAASTQFCATIADDPGMIEPPTFGFPAPAASIPDTLTAMQEFVDRWDALAAVSPSGIRPDVSRIADSARDIMDTVSSTRLVDNDQNVAVMSSVAQSTNIVGWAEQYCE
jgi:hypothetical protein